MLPKNRKVSKEVFSYSFKESKSFHSNYATLRVLNNINSNETTKFSFVVSRKVSNKANKRNLFKRRGFYIVSKINKNIKNGYFCIFYIKKDALGVSYNCLEKDVLILLKKANII